MQCCLQQNCIFCLRNGMLLEPGLAGLPASISSSSQRGEADRNGLEEGYHTILRSELSRMSNRRFRGTNCAFAIHSLTILSQIQIADFFKHCLFSDFLKSAVLHCIIVRYVSE